LRLSTQGVALGWLVKGLWPLPKNSHQTVVRLKRSTLGKPPWHDAVPLLQRLIFNCIVTAERSEGGKAGEAQSIRAERESRPKVARRAATGVAGNDPVPMRLARLQKWIRPVFSVRHRTFELERDRCSRPPARPFGQPSVGCLVPLGSTPRLVPRPALRMTAVWQPPIASLRVRMTSHKGFSAPI
jgi:hypothetical protein